MLVISREAGSSIYIGSAGETCVVTVLKLLPKRRSVAMLVKRTLLADPTHSKAKTVELAIDNALIVRDSTEVTVVDLRGEKARLGISAPKESSIHRLEVYEAIRQVNRNRWT